MKSKILLVILCCLFFGSLQHASARELNSGNIGDYCDPLSDSCYLNWNGITSIASGTFVGYEHINTLVIEGNELTTLPDDIGNLTGLIYLSLYYNQLTELPVGIGNLTNLQQLNLESNQLTTLPAEIENLTNLQYLYLYNNQLTTIPSEIGSLTNLQQLNLGNNQLTTIPSEIGNLTNLQYLYLYSNQLTVLPVSIGSLNTLSQLSLENNQLTTIPSEIGSLTNLQQLNLGNNQLTTLPSDILHLPNLLGFYLDSNQLTILPSEIGNLTGLEYLSLNNNQLTELPTEIGNLVNLYQLNIEGNQLTELPIEIGNLTNLTALSAYGNQLTTLPAEIGNLVNLGYLVLGYNQLTELPTEISNLVNLYRLNIEGNQLTELPIEIGSLTNLTALSAYGNQLTTLPAEIGNLSGLFRLGLESNQLTSLPAEIGNLINMQYFYLANNHLSTLPDEISNLTLLSSLSLDNNEFTTVPGGILNLPDKGWQYISFWGNCLDLSTLDSGGLDKFNNIASWNGYCPWNPNPNAPNPLDGELNSTNVIDYCDPHGTRCNLSNMGITSIAPDTFDDFQDLEGLDISYNELTEIPGTLGDITTLRYFYVNNNYLTTIPPNLINLSNLQYFTLGYNNIEILPNYFPDFPDHGWQYIDLNQNCINPDDIDPSQIAWYDANTYYTRQKSCRDFDLTVQSSLTSSPANVALGAPISYQLHYLNNGPDSINNVIIYHLPDQRVSITGSSLTPVIQVIPSLYGFVGDSCYEQMITNTTGPYTDMFNKWSQDFAGLPDFQTVLEQEIGRTGGAQWGARWGANAVGLVGGGASVFQDVFDAIGIDPSVNPYDPSEPSGCGISNATVYVYQISSLANGESGYILLTGQISTTGNINTDLNMYTQIQTSNGSEGDLVRSNNLSTLTIPFSNIGSTNTGSAPAPIAGWGGGYVGPEKEEDIDGEQANNQGVDDSIFNPTIQDDVCYVPGHQQTLYQGNSVTEGFKIAHQMLYSYGLTKRRGTSDYRPFDGITREEVAKFLVEFGENVLCRKANKIYDNNFTDIENADPTLIPYIKKSYEYGIFKGSPDGKFRPTELISQDELIATIVRLVTNEMKPEPEEDWAKEYRDAIHEYTNGMNLSTTARGNIAEMIYSLYKNNTYALQDVGYVIQ